MDFSGLFINSNAVKSLFNDVETDNICHAYLLCGADSLSLDTVASLFYARIACQSLIKPCLNCISCKKVINNSSNDVVSLPYGDKFLVSDAELLVEQSFIAPFSLKYRIINVTIPRRTRADAQNKMLKVLEEPNDDVIIVLKSESETALLPTICSRCKVITVQPPEISKIKQALIDNKLKPDKASEVATLSLGSLKNAQKASTEDTLKKTLELCFEVLLRMQRSKQILTFSTKVNKVKDFVMFLEYLQVIFRDAILINISKADLVILQSHLNKLYDIAGNYNIEASSQIIDKIDRIKQSIASNCSQAGAIDELLYSILEVNYLCKSLA